MPRTPQGIALRARIVLECAEGRTDRAVAEALGVSPQTVGKWRKRFCSQRLEGLCDAARGGAPPRHGAEDLEWVLALTLLAAPRDKRWSTRTLGKACGVSQSAVGRIWRGFGVRPYSRRKAHVAADSLIRAKFEDLLRLHLDSPRGRQVHVYPMDTLIGVDRWIAEMERSLPAGDSAELVVTGCPPEIESELRSSNDSRFRLHVAPDPPHWERLVEHWFTNGAPTGSQRLLRKLSALRDTAYYTWTPFGREVIDFSATSAGTDF